MTGKQNYGQRKRLIDNDTCPECFGELDTGWECNSCGFDAKPEAYSEIDKAREKFKKKKHAVKRWER